MREEVGGGEAALKLHQLGVPIEDLQILQSKIFISALYHDKLTSPTPCGVTWEVLKRFPNRVESFAQQIEQLNAHSPFKPILALFILNNPKISAAENSFCVLPNLLRGYAEYIRTRARIIGQDRQKRKHYRGLLNYELALVQLVKDFTDRPRFELVAELINATLLAAGQKGMSPGRLKMLYSKHPDLRTLRS